MSVVPSFRAPGGWEEEEEEEEEEGNVTLCEK